MDSQQVMSEELFVSPQVVDDLTEIHGFNKTVKDVFSGTVGGVAQVLVGQPFDIIKVRLQTMPGNTTAWEAIADLVRYEGLRGFYKGTMAPLVGVGACVSCQFGVNEAMKRMFKDINRSRGRFENSLSLGQYYTCGFVSGSANAVLATPIEHVRIRMQLQKEALANAQYKSTLDCTGKLLKEGALMRGFSATLMRTSHGFGVYFLTYETLIGWQLSLGLRRDQISAWKACLFGAVSGACFWAMTYPFDVVKSVMQADKLKNPAYGTNVVQVAKNIYKERGLRAFTKGFTPTMLRSLPVNGATFAAFEVTMRLLN
ncbi:carrier protein YMC1 [Kluyveromyces marxianus]|uniref:Carrier protein YMC1 n=2 Tax=Kluyveromyces marxianus TaxID=4911 RepID=W0T8Z9_KLUMD|nr:carrier protein YMC1 [Kluyveromyces marxianus DMKU3-1042]QGN15841.1 carrier protein YMC1 [Kluyveromyces marxianus]BAO40112.1 carrier protein YMC1 [Kluyveromyces marxianus DMKU3-1042]BAP71602.1 carrier protein YMC1 [Kluyveromyces marxianus]